MQYEKPIELRSASQGLLVALAALVLATQAWAAPADRPVDFNRDIRPILAENCFACHGFDEHARKAGLRLDRAESAYEELDGITPLVPRDPEASEAWLRISSTDPDEVMPPPSSHRVLSDRQKDLLRRWIEEGAAYADHWAFVPPTKVELPRHDVAPIDALVRARLASRSC